MRRLLIATTVAFLVVAPLAGSAGLRVTLLLLAGVALAVLSYREPKTVAGPLPRAVLAAWGFWAVVAAASIVWSVQPRYTLGELKAEILYGALAFTVFYLGARVCRWALWHGALLAGSFLVLATYFIDEILPIALTRHSMVGQGGKWSTHLVLVAPFVLAIGWPGMWGGRRASLIRVAALALLFAAAWQTGNRMVWVALGAQLVVATILSQPAFPVDTGRVLRRSLFAALAVAVVAFAFSIKDRNSLMAPGATMAGGFEFDMRPRIWSFAWDRFLEAPWLGHGFGLEILAPALQAVATPPGLSHPPVSHAHNVFLDMALQLGMVGLAAFFLVLVALARHYRACFNDPRAMLFGILGLTLLAGFVVKNLTDDFLHRHNALVFWALNGLLLGAVRPAGRFAAEHPTLKVPPAAAADSLVAFTCNLCGEANRDIPRPSAENRETPSCRRCGSTLRVRSILYLLSMELYGRPLTVPEFRVDRRIRGLGMSDWDGIADRLALKLGYVNTFYHQEPRLDISAIPESEVGRHRFVISSDVFEHIPHSGIDAAFRNARRLLARDGFLIFSVPFRKAGETHEFFPRLHDYRIVEQDGRRRLLNITADGVEESFDDLDFHDGGGMTLAMRMFSESDLLRRFRAAGFSSASVHGEHFAPYGILWPMDHSLPIVARA